MRNKASSKSAEKIALTANFPILAYVVTDSELRQFEKDVQGSSSSFELCLFFASIFVSFLLVFLFNKDLTQIQSLGVVCICSVSFALIWVFLFTYTRSKKEAKHILQQITHKERVCRFSLNKGEE